MQFIFLPPTSPAHSHTLTKVDATFVTFAQIALIYALSNILPKARWLLQLLSDIAL